METQKKKVDLKAIMQKAKEKTNSVKESTEKVESKTKPFKIVPNFSKYEFNGVILRNVETKAIIKFKTGRTKYQIKNDQAKNFNLSNEEIKSLFPIEEKVKTEKVKKEPKEKKAKNTSVEIQPNLEEDKLKVTDLSKKEIVSSENKSNKKHYMLHLKGCSVIEINELTQKPIPSIKRDIWRYQTGKTVL